MLKTRLVGVLVVKDGIVVQSVNFHRYLPVGHPSVAIDFLNRWGIDEIAILDIDATPQGRGPKHELLAGLSRHSLAAMSYGGGVGSVADFERVIQSGFEKVSLNTAVVDNPGLISQAARLFGSQSVIASIDARRIGDGYEAYVRCGRQATGLTPEALAKRAEDAGAGEILLTSIDRNGSKAGYDLELIRRVRDGVRIPVIVCGGVGHPRHFLEAINLGIMAVAAGNFFHYVEHSVVVAKRFLADAGAQARIDTYQTYEGFPLDDAGRLAKRGDEYLEKLRFMFIPEEVI